MVTIKEQITVSRDDAMFSKYEQMLSTDDWKKDEYTLSVTWTRVQTMIGETE